MVRQTRMIGLLVVALLIGSIGPARAVVPGPVAEFNAAHNPGADAGEWTNLGSAGGVLIPGAGQAASPRLKAGPPVCYQASVPGQAWGRFPGARGGPVAHLDDWTFEIWLRRTAHYNKDPHNEIQICGVGSGDGSQQFVLLLNEANGPGGTDAKLDIYVTGSNRKTDRKPGLDAVDLPVRGRDGPYTHVAVVWNNAQQQMTIYADGAAVRTARSTTGARYERTTDMSRWGILKGALGESDGRIFPGDISLVRLYDRQLTAEQIRENFGGGPNGTAATSDQLAQLAADKTPPATEPSANQEPAMLPRVGVTDQTTLVEQGQSNAVIVYPADDAAYQALAARIQQAVQRATSLELPARTDQQVLAGQFTIAPEWKRQNLILLGNLNTNRALVQLGGNFYVYATCRWPGANGFVVRTVANPFGTKANAIVLAGSDVAGVAAAVDRFVELLPEVNDQKSLIVPRLFQVVIDGQDQSSANAAADSYGDAFAGTYRLSHAVEAYSLTGSLDQFAAVRQQLEHYLKNDRAPVAGDYGTESAVRALDVVDTAALSDEENLKMDNWLLAWIQNVLDEKPYWNAQGRSWVFGAHQAAGVHGFYVVNNYLLKNGNPNPAARQLLEQQRHLSRTFLNYLSTSFTDGQKDMGLETWLALGSTPRYALAEGDMTFFDSGTATDVIKRYFYAGDGTGPAALAAFVFDDGRYKTLGPDGATLISWAFTMHGPKWVTPDELAPAEPDFLIGTKLLRASPTDWEHAHRNTGGWYTPLDYDQTFHVIGMTDGVKSTDTMLVLNGWDSSNAPGQSNSIRTFRQAGQVHLTSADSADNRTPRSGRFYQNSIMVESAEYDSSTPCAAELVARHDGPLVGMTCSRLSNYRGVDWDRNLFWRRGKYFVVIDLCRLTRSGPMTIVNQWWNPNVPAIQGNRWVANTDSARFQLVMANPGSVSSQALSRAGPYQLTQTKNLVGRAGQRVSFMNMFYVASREEDKRYEVRLASPGVMVVKGSDNGGEQLALVGCGTPDEPTRLGSIQIDAERFFVSPTAVALDAAGRLDVNGHTIAIAPDGSIGPDDATRLRAALSDVWDQSQSPQMQDETGSVAAADLPLRLSMTPRRATGLKTGYRPILGVQPEKNSDGTVTWDLGRPERVARIDGIGNQAEGESIRVRYSSGGFDQESHTVEASVGREKEWVHYQYGYAASLGLQTIGPIDQVARYFRVEHSKEEPNPNYGRFMMDHWHQQAWNVTGHNRHLFNRPFWQDVVFRSDQPEIRYTHTVVADLEDDSQQELVVATDQNELAVLDWGGTPRWKHVLDAPVTGLICEDLDDDGVLEVICATHDHAVSAYGADGVRRFRVDILAEEPRRSAPNSIGALRYENGEAGLLVGTYHQFRLYDRNGQLVGGFDPRPGFYLDGAPARCRDFTGDGVDDFILRDNVWGLVSLNDGRSREAIATADGAGGPTLAIIPWPTPVQERYTRMLVIGESGLMMLEVTDQHGKSTGGDATLIAGGLRGTFSLPISPIVGWSLLDVDDDGRDEILLATRFGAVLIVSEQGKVVAKTVAASELRDVTVARGPDKSPRIILATDRGILALDTALRPLGETTAEAAGCMKTETISTAGGDRVLCLFDDGTVVHLDFEE